MKRMKRLGNKGITIVEVIVALSILGIIMMAAITLSGNAVIVSNTTVMKFKAFNLMADYVEVFQESESEEEFITLVNNTYSPEINKLEDANNTYNIIYNDILCNVDIEDNTIFIKSYNANKTDKLLYEYSYSKAYIETQNGE